MKTSVDITWVIGDAMIWSNVEPCMGIVSACLPTIRPLLHQIPQLRLWGFFGSSSRGWGSTAASNKIPDSSVDPVSITASANRSAYRSTTGKRNQFRPEEDEIYLTTDVEHTHSLRRDGSGAPSSGSVDNAESIPMGITVNQNFHWREENHKGM